MEEERESIGAACAACEERLLGKEAEDGMEGEV